MRYKVMGDHAVFGAKPGNFVDINIPESQERRLIARGSLVRAPKQPRRSSVIKFQRDEAPASPVEGPVSVGLPGLDLSKEGTHHDTSDD